MGERTAIRNYETYFPLLVREVSGLNIALAKSYLDDAGRAFCIDSKLYEETLTAIDVVSGTATYDLTDLIPENTYISEIKDVYYGTGADQYTDKPLDSSEYELSNDLVTFRLLTTPTASITAGLIVKVILIPEPNSLWNNETFFYKFFEAIDAKAKVLIYKSPKKPYTDIELGSYWETQYNEYLAKAKAEYYDKRKPKSIKLLQEEVEGLETDIAKDLIVKSARRFFMDSELYESTFTAIDVVLGTTQYDLSALIDTDAQIYKIKKVYNGTSIDIYNDRPLSESKYYIDNDFETLNLLTTPTANITGGLIVQAILIPKYTSDWSNSDLTYRYFEAISAYVKTKAYAIPNKTYTNTELSVYWMAQYKEILSEFKKEVITDRKSQIIDTLTRELKDLDLQTATLAQSDALRQFCFDTEIYQLTLDAVNVVSGTSTYDLTDLLPDNTYIIRIKDAFTGADIDVRKDCPISDSLYELDADDDTTFRFIEEPTESVTDGLIVQVILGIVPDVIYTNSVFTTRYFDAVTSKTKSILYNYQDKPYTNPELSRYWANKYQKYLNIAKKEKYTQRKSGRMQMNIDPNLF